MTEPDSQEPRLASYDGRRISVRIESIAGGLYVVATLGVWSAADGRRGYIKLAPPIGEFPSRQDAHDAGVVAGQRAIDQGLA